MVAYSEEGRERYNPAGISAYGTRSTISGRNWSNRVTPRSRIPVSISFRRIRTALITPFSPNQIAYIVSELPAMLLSKVCSAYRMFHSRTGTSVLAQLPSHRGTLLLVRRSHDGHLHPHTLPPYRTNPGVSAAVRTIRRSLLGHCISSLAPDYPKFEMDSLIELSTTVVAQ